LPEVRWEVGKNKRGGNCLRTVQRTNLTVLLPAHNEEKGIASVISEVIKESQACRVIVVDSACTDRTPKIARSLGVEVLSAPKGKGNAIRHALKNIKSEYLIMMDSDNTYPAKYIPEIVSALDTYDVVMGCRRWPEAGAFPWANRWGNNFITGWANLLYRQNVQDLCTGMWGFRGYVAENLKLNSAGFTLEAEIFTQCVKQGLFIGQVPISYRRRDGERKINRWDHVKILWFLLKEWGVHV